MYSTEDKISDLRSSLIDWHADVGREGISEWWASMGIANKFGAMSEIARLKREN